MNPVLPQDAVDFGEAARKALAGLGGVDVARQAEATPGTRHEVGEVLAALGLDDLDPRADADTAAAAAVLCEEAGRVALPYPVAGAMLRHGDDALPTALVPRDRARVDHGDLFEAWHLCTPTGTATGRPSRPALATRLGPFTCDLTPDASPTTSETETDHLLRCWWLTLSAWTILGAVDRAVELATDHVQDRVQFGQALSAFQTVRFQLADAAVAVAGLRELALFTLWRLDAAPGQAWPDVLALRSHALDVARTTLRTTQQLHGASGLCDEVDVSIIVRHLQPTLRLPSGAEAVAAELAEAIEADGFDGLFPHGSHGSVP